MTAADHPSDAKALVTDYVDIRATRAPGDQPCEIGVGHVAE